MYATRRHSENAGVNNVSPHVPILEFCSHRDYDKDLWDDNAMQ